MISGNNTLPLLKYDVSSKCSINDKIQLREFIDESDYIANNVLSDHLPLQKLLQPADGTIEWEAVDDYIDAYASNNKQKLIQAKKDFTLAWSRVESLYWQSLLPLFGQYYQSQYIGYISIFTLHPILNAASFQIAHFLPVNNAVVVSAHELLHFLFYPYILSYWDSMSPSWQDEERLRTLAEVFNGLMLNHSPLAELIVVRDSCHPGISDIVNRLLPKWPFFDGWGTDPLAALKTFSSNLLQEKPFGSYKGEWGLRDMFLSV